MYKLKPAVVTVDPHKLGVRPTYAHVASTIGSGSSNVVMTAGQVGSDESGKVPADVTEQITLAFKNLQRCLDASGATVQDIIKLVYYIVDYDPNNRVHFGPLKTFLQGHRPPATLVPVPCLASPEFKFEVEAYIAIPQQPLREVDVVVVGAGLSGLKSAYELQRKGYSVAVVEARDRVGGKTWSIENTPGDGKIVDRGAAWINDTNQTESWALTQALGLQSELTVQNTVGNIVQQEVTGELSQFAYGSVTGSDAIVTLRDATENLCQTIDIRDPVRTGGAHLDALSFAQWVEKTMKESGADEEGYQIALRSATIWTNAMLGLEPTEISALFFLNYCKSGGGLLTMRSDQKNGGQYLRFHRGTQSLSIGLAGLLKPESVLVSSPVRKIIQTSSGVRVVSARGEFITKRVIVSVPTPLYKEIQFEPALPAAKAELGRLNLSGTYNKFILRYSSPWWRSGGLCGMILSYTGPVCVTRDSSTDVKGQYSLTCFLGGAKGREIVALSEAERYKLVTDQIKTTLGSGIPGGPAAVPEPISFTEYEWSKDQWAQGCPCPAAPPGAMTKYETALRSTHGKIHFVGTETAYEWKGYMDGALRSGIRGADEVSKALELPKL